MIYQIKEVPACAPRRSTTRANRSSTSSSRKRRDSSMSSTHPHPERPRPSPLESISPPELRRWSAPVDEPVLEFPRAGVDLAALVADGLEAAFVAMQGV